MKKFFALLLTFALLSGLAACSGGAAQTAAPTTAAPAATEPVATSAPETAAPTDSSTEAPAEGTQAPETAGEGETAAGGGTLVVYFSATGNTENVANMIAEATGADIFALIPAEPYTDGDLDWTDDSSRVVYEHDNPDDRVVPLEADTVENWDSYDTVFIGYPIWWGIAAWPVDGFIAANDFTGKTVIPFCTSSSSGLGDSGTLLAEAAGTGDWLEGERFTSRTTEEEVQAWIEGLGL